MFGYLMFLKPPKKHVDHRSNILAARAIQSCEVHWQANSTHILVLRRRYRSYIVTTCYNMLQT